LRFGIHIGPVGAGVLGEKKTIYDLWGDTVNKASRMESYGEPGRVHVSAEVANSLGPAFSLIERGVRDIKGFGSIATFWVDGVND